jgi:hypothetical protein
MQRFCSNKLTRIPDVYQKMVDAEELIDFHFSDANNVDDFFDNAKNKFNEILHDKGILNANITTINLISDMDDQCNSEITIYHRVPEDKVMYAERLATKTKIDFLLDNYDKIFNLAEKYASEKERNKGELLKIQEEIDALEKKKSLLRTSLTT